MNNAILTKDNMIRRNWPGDPSCYFCSQPGTVDHLLFQCSTAKVVWSMGRVRWLVLVLVLVFYERKTLLAGWFELAETNKRTGR